ISQRSESRNRELTRQVFETGTESRPYRRPPASNLGAFVQRPKRTIPLPLLLRLSFLLFVFTVPIESLNLTLNLGPVSIARLAGLGLFGVSILYAKKCYSF